LLGEVKEGKIVRHTELVKLKKRCVSGEDVGNAAVVKATGVDVVVEVVRWEVGEDGT
jgi:hypothetical protein